MRKSIFIIFLLMLLAVGFVAADCGVSITPSSPGDNDDITCDVGCSTDRFVYKWYQNNEYDGESGTVVSSTWPAYKTNTGDTWRCKAYTPGTYPFGGYYIGEASVVIGGGSQNHAPVLNYVGNKAWCAAERGNIYLSATDADSDSLTYSAPIKPTGSSFSGTHFSWTPGCCDIGTHTVKFEVRDGKGGYDSETITITVND
ncbi:MAG: hypothetical protein DRJ35_07375, partial [Thermoprotei archaeon]